MPYPDPIQEASQRHKELDAFFLHRTGTVISRVSIPQITFNGLEINISYSPKWEGDLFHAFIEDDEYWEGVGTSEYAAIADLVQNFCASRLSRQ